MADASFRRLQTPLRHALTSAAQSEACTAETSAAQAGSVPDSHLRLHVLPGLPLLPTLNGWLLGYPVVYSVRTAHEVDVAARHLSSVSLLHCAAYADCSIVADVTPQGIDKLDWLYAFTLPASLSTAADIEAMEWRPSGAPSDCSGTGTDASEGPWSAVQRRVEASAPRAIVL